jgi:predicted DNA-binding transcriptional regulator AlpA
MTHNDCCRTGSPSPRPFDRETLADYLRVSLGHLDDCRAEDPTFPAPRMLGTLPRWSPAVIDAWIAGASSRLDPVQPAPVMARRRGEHRVA